VPEQTPFKMIRTTNVRNGFIDVDTVRYVEEDVFKRWTRRLLPKRGDVVLTREAPLGDVGMVRTDDSIFLGQRLYHFRTDPRRLNAHFLLYSLLGPDLQAQIKACGSGATVEHMRLQDVQSLEIAIPSLAEQCRIGETLAAYDDLVENNRRRIQILEQMARALYREWFVEFRFPGRAGVCVVGSQAGTVPKGWQVRSLNSLITEHIGGGWGNDFRTEDHTEAAWVIRGTDIPSAKRCRVRDVPYRYHTQSNLRPRRLRAGDIIFEVSGGSKGQPLGRTLLVSRELLAAFGSDAVMCASFCKRIQTDASQYGAELLYLSFLEGYQSGEIEQYQVQSTGISNFQWDSYLHNTYRVVPPEALRTKFRDIVDPQFSLIATLGLQSENLRRTRDLLLPRLLSGQITLTEAAA
jgi:type I restriction enzyme S subunit